MNAWAVAIASNVIWPLITVLINWRKDSATVDKAKADAAAVIQETSAELVQQMYAELQLVKTEQSSARIRISALEQREMVLIGWIRLLHQVIRAAGMTLPDDMPEEIRKLDL